MSEIRPWERQNKESKPAFEAFACYRDQDKRSQRGVSRTIGKNTTLIVRWAKRWEWAKRVRAYDRHREKLKLDARDEVSVEIIIGESKTMAEINESTVKLWTSFNDRVEEMLTSIIKANKKRQGVMLGAGAIKDLATILEKSQKGIRIAKGADVGGSGLDELDAELDDAARRLEEEYAAGGSNSAEDQTS